MLRTTHLRQILLCTNPIRSKTFPCEEFIIELCSVKVVYLAVSGTTDLLACQFFIVKL